MYEDINLISIILRVLFSDKSHIYPAHVGMSDFVSGFKGWHKKEINFENGDGCSPHKSLMAFSMSASLVASQQVGNMRLN